MAHACGAWQLVAVTDDVVAVNKPFSMPVHVAGQYRKNTVLGVLEAEHPELGEVHPCHRLDKCATSQSHPAPLSPLFLLPSPLPSPSHAA